MGKKPVHTIRLGRVTAAIWQNETKIGPRYNVTFSRFYKDEAEKYHDSRSFGGSELLHLAKVAEMVHLWFYYKGLLHPKGDLSLLAEALAGIDEANGSVSKTELEEELIVATCEHGAAS